MKLPKSVRHYKLLSILALSLVIITLLWLTSSGGQRQYHEAMEKVMLRIDPTASRAFAYGELHFNATNSAEYDVNAAEQMFQLAAKIDPSTPYVFHEIGRIAFLRGKFIKALELLNLQITMHGDTQPNAFYVRGLIEGYMGKYKLAANDYEHYLKFDPKNWAAINDYAWVLLKSGRARDAADATATGLLNYPDNPWLLNTNAIALYEMGDLKLAHDTAYKATLQLPAITITQWLQAYPGNDPAIASEGVITLKESILRNMHSIDLALASSTVQ